MNKIYHPEYKSKTSDQVCRSSYPTAAPGNCDSFRHESFSHELCACRHSFEYNNGGRYDNRKRSYDQETHIHEQGRYDVKKRFNNQQPFNYERRYDEHGHYQHAVMYNRHLLPHEHSDGSPPIRPYDGKYSEKRHLHNYTHQTHYDKHYSKCRDFYYQQQHPSYGKRHPSTIDYEQDPYECAGFKW